MRPLAVLLAVWSLLIGTIVLHTGLEQHGALDGPTRVFLTGEPGSGARLGTASSIELPACPACVLQLQTLGDVVPVSQRLAGLVRFGAAAPPPPGALDLSSPRLPASRGPPLA
jgi:hypothetical protein